MAITGDAAEDLAPVAQGRGKALGIGLAVVVVASGVSFAAGRQIKSPAEVAARTTPPVASLISVPVERQVLSADVVTRGTPGTNGIDPQHLAVTPGDAPASLVGASVVLTIKVESTQGEVLAVPVAALSQAADDSSRVQVQMPDKSTRYVTVTPGLAAKGMVAVTPVDGTLEPGTLVVGRGYRKN